MANLFQKIRSGRKIYDPKKKIAEILKEIYSQGKSPDSSGSFGFERTGKID